MDIEPNHPLRTRRMLTTLELVINRKAGPHGSVELIESNPKCEQPVYFFWPLDAQGGLSDSQLQDLTAVVARQAQEAVVMRVLVQLEAQQLLST